MRSDFANLVSQCFWCEKLSIDSLDICYERWLLINHEGGIEVLVPIHFGDAINPSGQGARVTFSFAHGIYQVLHVEPMMGAYKKEQFIFMQ